jgi:hypothetical protein
MSMKFDPKDWYWVVGDDEMQAYSSALGSYVPEWPSDRVTRIASEAELNDVLAPYGLRGSLITADHVRAEAQRRIIVLTGATDLSRCFARQLNASMRATELVNKKALGAIWTPDEAAEAAALQAFADAIKAIRAASNAMEPSPPADYTDDTHWPPAA